MTEDKFRYHRRLREIAERDAAFLEKKDRSYGASWKESGRSAWFMCKRMIDRLTNMMARPPIPKDVGYNDQNVLDTIQALIHAEKQNATVKLPGTYYATAAMMGYLRQCNMAEDLLAALEADARAMQDPAAEAPDGTRLAVVRDLRRYLLLAEAEILERTRGNINAGTGAGGTGSCARTTAVPVEDSNRHADRQGTNTSPPWIVDIKWHADRQGTNTSPPWVVDSKWRFNNGMGQSGRSEVFDTWWRSFGIKDHWALREYVAVPRGKVPPLMLTTFYSVMTNDDGSYSQYVLDIGSCPGRFRTKWPRLRQEVNKKELDEQVEWSRLLYVKDSGDDKWRLKPGCEAWASW